MDILITFIDGSRQAFCHEGRAGGSYTKTLKYVDGMVVITDEWYNETAFPQATVKSVQTGENGAYRVGRLR